MRNIVTAGGLAVVLYPALANPVIAAVMGLYCAGLAGLGALAEVRRETVVEEVITVEMVEEDEWAQVKVEQEVEVKIEWE